jgi:hypothetical protein
MTDQEMNANVNHPTHYTDNKTGYEVIIPKRCLCSDLADPFKYVSRRELKGVPRQDILKSVWYLRDYIAHPKIPYTCTDNKEIPELLYIITRFAECEPVPAIKSVYGAIHAIVYKYFLDKVIDTRILSSIVDSLETYAKTLPMEKAIPNKASTEMSSDFIGDLRKKTPGL